MSVQLIDRPEVEPDERFSVTLFSDDPAVSLRPKETTILILDDDGRYCRQPEVYTELVCTCTTFKEATVKIGSLSPSPLYSCV